MQGEKEERWMKLCREAVNEQDPHRLLELIEQINNMLYEKEQRLEEQGAGRSTAA